jgi:fucose 4-O-acetylase-like acetyltransferase
MIEIDVITFFFNILLYKICEYCKKRGGHIFCRSRGCGLRTHFPCAFTHGWLLKEETFMALCPFHLDQAGVT